MAVFGLASVIRWVCLRGCVDARVDGFVTRGGWQASLRA